MSRSFVARGCACADTACAPTIRYLTLWAFKTDKSSLKSGYIPYRALHRILFLSNFRNRCHPLMQGSALPIAIFVRLDLVEVSKTLVFANGLVHFFLLTCGLTVLGHCTVFY